MSNRCESCGKKINSGLHLCDCCSFNCSTIDEDKIHADLNDFSSYVTGEEIERRNAARNKNNDK